MSLNLKSYFDDKLTFFFQEGEGGGAEEKFVFLLKTIIWLIFPEFPKKKKKILYKV